MKGKQILAALILSVLCLGGTALDAESETPATRAQTAVAVWEAAGCPQVNYAMPFADVPQTLPYAEAVRWCAAEGLMQGYSEAAFGPEDAITRQQLATMLWRYMGEPESDGDLSQFKDGAKVSSYAVEAMEWAVANGIFQGNSAKMLNPTATATRAHIAQVMMNFLEQ